MRLPIYNLIFVFVVGSSFPVSAQNSQHTIKILAKVSPDGVSLRWAPINATVWQLGNQHGYTIDRYTLDADGKLADSNQVSLHSTPIRPLSSQQFDELGKTTPDAAVISELIYQSESKNTEAQNETPSGLFKKSEDLENRFGMALLFCDLTPGLAQAAGLFFKDSTSVKGARYIYRITMATTAITVEPGVIVVDVVEPKPLQPFNDLEATFGDKTVTLSWSILTHVGIYSAYTIEKSMDGKNFKSITELPYIPMRESESSMDAHFVDSLENNSQAWHYRIIGITPFGDHGPPSNIAIGKGKDNMAGLLILREVKRNNKNNVEVTWEFPTSFQDKIGGFLIERAPRAEGPFKSITKKTLAKNIRSGSEAMLTSSAYYRIRAVDAQGVELTSSFPYFFHVEDNTPPAIPLELKGKINTAGIVTLSWKNNMEADLLGYRVFTSHDLKEEFVEVTTTILLAPQYHDSVNIRVLNKELLYKVIAVDNNFNTSDYSQPLFLYKPDIIAPAAPVFEKIEVKGRSVAMWWTNSPSDDVSRYSLSRLVEKDTAQTLLLSWRASKPRVEFEDQSIQPGVMYRYVLSAVDSSGNASSAQSKTIVVSPGVHKAVSDITATIERDKKIITLRWNYDQPVRKCLLYKRKNNEPFTLYETLDGTLKQFTDGRVIINNTYSYKVQLLLDKNAKTELSAELKVPF